MADPQERAKLYKFTKILALKVAQVVVQSRQGKKITHEEYDGRPLDNGMLSSPPNLQWFNLSIPDEPDVNFETKKVLNGEVVAALSNVLCIEISVKTAEGDEMVLEIWTVKMTAGTDPTMSSANTIYYRMSLLLKSTLTISRITPAYKMSRAQSRESYKIFHRIYGGPSNINQLGEESKVIRVGSLRTAVGTLEIAVAHRTKMALAPAAAASPVRTARSELNTNHIMLKSDHFTPDSLRRPSEGPQPQPPPAKKLDLSRPLRAGAFVDADEISALHRRLREHLPVPLSASPPARPCGKCDQLKTGENSSSSEDSERQGREVVVATAKAASAVTATAPVPVPVTATARRDYEVMEFPFADGSPITELASFYQEVVRARPSSGMAGEWCGATGEGGTGVDDLAAQLQAFEAAVPEFDNMVASMFSTSSDDH